ncbi:hypothetical protein FNV43_RR11887 [Rhamnella rubrinervis]|uniref:DUF676 domain-containing protein n=1 Tax=Rhamnella rubrinervis TaxID=2594499 RepID=A0A8K0MI52_9ROSA|nr:hypothetical protein FNV43_RR11887 [Rhamnella rubrinervis]
MTSLELKEEDGSGIVEEAENGSGSRKKVDSNEIRNRGHSKKKKMMSKNQSFYMPKFRCFSINSEPVGRGSFEEVENGSGSKKKVDSNEIRNRGRANKKKMKSKNQSFYMPKFRCFSIKSESVGGGNFDVEVDDRCRTQTPTHLIIMVNGLIGSARDWKFTAKQFLKRYPEDVVVHCSGCNYSTLTFEGVDVMGERLAEEVISVIKRHPGVQKISFIGHSLGGLIARYAIARLYERDITGELSQENGVCECHGSEDKPMEEKFEGKIAGLEPVNFITIATPHLGSRGHKQVPVFCGFYSVEKMASQISGVLGKTGRHLFLTDSDNGKPPLLLQMVKDSGDLKFMSALLSFRRRVAYANIRFDHLVGWGTSSMRRQNELPKLKKLSRDDKYPHIVNVETSKPANPQEEISLAAEVNGCKNIDAEEEMIRGLTKLSWERIDVSFRGSENLLYQLRWGRCDPTRD